MNPGELVHGRGIYFRDHGRGVVVANNMGILTVWWFDESVWTYTSQREIIAVRKIKC